MVLDKRTSRSTGDDARLGNIDAARAIAEVIKSTLGPKGMDKMLVDSMGEVTITNDGATILKGIEVVHPAARMVIEVANTQDDECGDGTTTSVVLTGELLRASADLINEGIHPTTITRGFNRAAEFAAEEIKKLGTPITSEALYEIARTSLSSKNVGSDSEHIAKMVVDAVNVVHKPGIDRKDIVSHIGVMKVPGGSIADSTTHRGVIVDKEPTSLDMPQIQTYAKVALLDLDLLPPAMEGVSVQTDASGLAGMIHDKDGYLREMANAVISTGATVVFVSRGIDALVEHCLTKAGITVYARVLNTVMDRLRTLTGAKVVKDITDLTEDSLGSRVDVETVRKGNTAFTLVSPTIDSVNTDSVSIVLRGGTNHVVEEARRALEDCINITALAKISGIVTTGAGSTAMELSYRVGQYALTVGGREQMAVEAYAKAFEVIPRTLAENAGMDEIDVLLNLRTEHAKGNTTMGVDVNNGEISDMSHVIEPVDSGIQQIRSATEAAVMILRVDDVIAARTIEE